MGQAVVFHEHLEVLLYVVGLLGKTRLALKAVVNTKYARILVFHQFV